MSLYLNGHFIGMFHNVVDSPLLYFNVNLLYYMGFHGFVWITIKFGNCIIHHRRLFCFQRYIIYNTEFGVLKIRFVVIPSVYLLQHQLTLIPWPIVNQNQVIKMILPP